MSHPAARSLGRHVHPTLGRSGLVGAGETRQDYAPDELDAPHSIVLVVLVCVVVFDEDRFSVLVSGSTRRGPCSSER
ncbi:MAG: hypothetical protein EXR69_08885 [Myxococcales bacterium]|nr:hypothetical protein [Myxococcales bacterium]